MATAALRAVAHLIPDVFPLLSPLERSSADRTGLRGSIAWTFHSSNTLIAPTDITSSTATGLNRLGNRPETKTIDLVEENSGTSVLVTDEVIQCRPGNPWITVTPEIRTAGAQPQMAACGLEETVQLRREAVSLSTGETA